MNILYIGDIMGAPGVQAVERTLPDLRHQHKLDLVVAQAENVTDGRGISRADYEKLKQLGIDFMTGGNWSLYREDIHEALDDPNEPIIRPANYLSGTPGVAYKVWRGATYSVLVVSLLGQIVGKDADKPVDNPLRTIDQILDDIKHVKYSAVVVNFHGDYSSEKRIIGYYLDGRVTAVIGDHWHVPTADALVLPKGTAHITDVGMCGTLHSSLGLELDGVITRWRDGRINRNQLAEDGPLQFNAVLIKTDDAGLAKSIEPIQKILKG